MAATELTIAFLVQVLLVTALAAWGRWVARRHGDNVWWRRAARVPRLAFLISLMGLIIVCGLMLTNLRALADVEPAAKATRLASGIRLVMNVAAPFAVVSVLGYVGSVLAFVVGTIRTPRV